MTIQDKPVLYIKIFPTSHCPLKEVPEGWYPFELRTASDNPDDTLIQDGVLIDNEGSMAASRDIMQDGIDAGISRTRHDGALDSELGILYSEVRCLN